MNIHVRTVNLKLLVLTAVHYTTPEKNKGTLIAL